MSVCVLIQGAFEKIGQFIKKTVSKRKKNIWEVGGREKRRAQRATTGERSELPRVSAGASAASYHERAQRAAKTSVASLRLSISTLRSSGAVPAGPLV